MRESINKLLSSLTSDKTIINQFKLSEDQLSEYFSKGYVVVKNFYTNAEIIEIAALSNKLKNKAFDLAKRENGAVIFEGTQFVIESNDREQPIIKRIVWVGASEPKLLEYGRAPKIKLPVSQILQSKSADHLINQIHYKLPHDKVTFPWHQDIQNRKAFCTEWHDQNDQGSYVVAITAIDDNTLDNGPLYVIPKSNLHGELKFEKFCKTEQLPKDVDASSAVPLLMQAGDTVFMHPYLIHGSWENDSNKERKVFINGFSSPGANSSPYPGQGSGEQITLLEDYSNNHYIIAISGLASRELIEAAPLFKYAYNEILKPLLPTCVLNLLPDIDTGNNAQWIGAHFVAGLVAVLTFPGIEEISIFRKVLYTSFNTIDYATKLLAHELYQEAIQDRYHKNLTRDTHFDFIHDCAAEVAVSIASTALSSLAGSFLIPGIGLSYTAFAMLNAAAISGLYCYASNKKLEEPANITYSQAVIPYLADSVALFSLSKFGTFNFDTFVNTAISLEQGIAIMSSVVVTDQLTKLSLDLLPDATFEYIDSIFGLVHKGSEYTGLEYE